ncbi:MAG TPA: dTDP-4-dehydrorhamnose 3,5-epimerase, partial [Petrotogaceae bacterium]|nr:dTDP-4-dehydrorhamnose 3,5-epimerase [Petrotogaceae bacterium]
MQIRKEELPMGLMLLHTERFKDSRGFFIESFNCDDIKKVGIKEEFILDCISSSHFGVIRGLHFQRYKPQSKLIKVLTGRILDVAVDIRKDSPSFMDYFSVELNGDDDTLLYIPKGFAHGFLALAEPTMVLYKADGYYDPKDESGIVWNDP